MTQRARGLITVILIATTGCSTSIPLVEIRPARTGAVAQEETASAHFLQAQGQMALGNVALALEGFRKAIRLDPAHANAMLGIAACYESMGRMDVASVYFEKALAVAPGDRRVYALFADALERNNMIDEANRLRTESAARDAGENQRSGNGQPPVPKLGETAARMKLAEVMDPAAKGAPDQNVSIAPVTPVRTGVGFAQWRANGARIERLSLHEVALRTSTSSPMPEIASISSRALQKAQSAAGKRQAQPAKVRLTVLNAARIAGLAARTRHRLGDARWGEILIGDAPSVLRRTEIRYAADRHGEARWLSATLGVPSKLAQLPKGSIALWLGRDATRIGAPL